NKVVGVVQQGYRCGERLIRPARVMVSGGKGPDAGGEGS
ncbi:MAG TPA: nucleotide exchange factor GrpE, partial [candidate division Zixibacteria bacterium]|nr:nucleotide exchange factor GrpE [candidate division Zixibacteria bacterium]